MGLGVHRIGNPPVGPNGVRVAMGDLQWGPMLDGVFRGPGGLYVHCFAFNSTRNHNVASHMYNLYAG